MRRDGALLAVAALAFAALALAIAGRGLECPGLYYDEVIQAEPALWFLRAEARPLQVPGMSGVSLFGRPFPLMTQGYMGALKSQLLVPVFALVRPDAHSLRLATLALGLLGLVAAMAFAWRAFDLPTALCCGALLAVDPSLLFLSRHDWGSFAVGFLLRCLALGWLLAGWRSRSAARFFAGGVAAGLCVYNKIDGAVPLAACGLAIALSSREFWRGLRERAALLAAAAGGMLLGAAPILLNLRRLLASSGAPSEEGGMGELTLKLLALRTTLDGSYFERLMRAGGSFERIAEQSATAAPLPLLFLVASLALAIFIARDLRRGQNAGPLGFALLAAFLSLAGILLTPRAVRVHHFLNVWPLPHLVVAVAGRQAWRRFDARLARAAVALAFAAALVGALRADRATLESFRASCGKGRWSDALTRLAPELVRKHAEAVCLDWGCAFPLRFARPDLAVAEPIWSMNSSRSSELSGQPWQVYLLLEPPYAVFPSGPALLDAVAGLPPDAVSVEHHTDREGGPALVSVRFARPHRLVYQAGRYEVELR